MAPTHWLITMSPSCQICFVRPYTTIYQVPNIGEFPVCGACINADAYPVDMLVYNAVALGDAWTTTQRLNQMIDSTIKHLGLSREKFDNLVELSILELKFSTHSYGE